MVLQTDITPLSDDHTKNFRTRLARDLCDFSRFLMSASCLRSFAPRWSSTIPTRSKMLATTHHSFGSRPRHITLSARSPLHQRRFWSFRYHFSAFFEIYKIILIIEFLKTLQKFAKNCKLLFKKCKIIIFDFFQKICKFK